MADILDACGRASRLPSVVPEFPGLTAGGCFLGAGIESSSFRFGQWGDNGGVVGVECVDGEGNFHRLSLGPRRTRRESFILTDDAEPDAAEPEASSSAGNAAPGPRPDLRANDLKSSFGSLAVLTSLTLRLMPHPPGDRVRLAYILCRTPQMMVDVVRELSRMPGVDNVEGLAFSRREFVCIVGWLVSAADAAKARRARWLLRRSAGRSEGLGEAVAFDRGWDEYYFKHARRMASLGTPIPPTTTAEELPALLASLLNLSPTAGSSGGAQVPNVPFVHTSIPSYAFRHDRLAFWMAYPHFFSSVSVGPVAGAGLSDNWYSRALLDPMLRTKKLYQRLHRFSAQRDFVIQDFYVPMDSDGSEGAPSPAVSFLTTVVATATGPGIFPIWLCPIVGTSGPAGGGKLDPHYVAEGPDGRRRERMFLNFGIYGLPTLRCPVQSLRASVLGSAGGPNPPSDAQEPDLSAAAEEGDDERRADTKQVMLWTRHLERLCREHGGRKMLYAVSTYTRGEFWSIYDRGWHGAVKGEWDPRGVFMGVDEKVLGGW
ncbi:hypothetical protein DFJ74DRAFT_682777 [Hyaloraphidium curvatum]|nr:hypothetical protein DFJ74DRAFT_682777 [Hyaloraphidium curvatum]